MCIEQLVLIPGVLCNRRLWAAQIAVLSAHASIHVPEISRQTSIAQMAFDILDSVRGPFSVAGFSLGSQVALQMVEVAADRVDRLALLSATRGGLLPTVQEFLRKAILTIEREEFTAYLESAYPAYVAPAHAHDASIKRCFMDMAYEVGPAAGLLQMKALLDLKQSFSRLKQISCPTIVIGGSEDHRTTPAAHETLAHEIPAASLVLINDAAHFTPLEQPSEITAELLHWLQLPPIR